VDTPGLFAHESRLAPRAAKQQADAVARLRQAGMVLVGKTHMHEFAYGVTNDNPDFRPARNPWDPTRVPGGSSGGSAAAVASSQCAASLGSDTGGSIRTPAAVLRSGRSKTLWSRESLWSDPSGLVAGSRGALTKSVEDAAIMLAAIAGPDPIDPTASSQPLPDYRKEMLGSIRGLRLGVPRQYFFEHVDPEIQKLARAVIEKKCDRSSQRHGNHH
jgi:aspartyl-tRNA(Asn)/glutamyl-tRNA(Gln) amidotransferase subunit A